MTDMTRDQAEAKLRRAIRDRKLFIVAVCWGTLERLTGISVRLPLAGEGNPMAVVQ